jgi:S-ribosylhomocysteine lyase
MRKHLNSSNCEIIDISPMGCRTGFYMSVIGRPTEKEVAEAWSSSMADVVASNQIAEANKYQCGTYTMHSLGEAKEIANNVLSTQIDIMDNNSIKLDLNKIL